LIFGQPKKSGNSKKANQRELVWGELVKAKCIDEDPDFKGSELREDQSSCAKKMFFMETNHICTALLQKTESQRLLRPWLDALVSILNLKIRSNGTIVKLNGD
jgi:hypothetical protein